MQRRVFLAGAALAPGLAWAQSGGMITPQNELERAFLSALGSAAARPAFFRELLVSPVVLALASSAPDAAPREVELPNGVRAGAIFTSGLRLDAVLGPASPRRVASGRAALESLRGKHAVLNFRLRPMLTLEPEDIARHLDGAG